MVGHANSVHTTPAPPKRAPARDDHGPDVHTLACTSCGEMSLFRCAEQCAMMVLWFGLLAVDRLRASSSRCTSCLLLMINCQMSAWPLCRVRPPAQSLPSTFPITVQTSSEMPHTEAGWADAASRAIWRCRAGRACSDSSGSVWRHRKISPARHVGESYKFLV